VTKLFKGWDTIKRDFVNQILEAPNSAFVTLVGIDLDYFAHHLDCFGYVKSDETLARIEELFLKYASTYHASVARIGGDKFAIAALTNNKRLHIELGKQIRDDIKKMYIPLVTEEYRVENGLVPQLKYITCVVVAIIYPLEQNFSTKLLIEDSAHSVEITIEHLFEILVSTTNTAKVIRDRLIEIDFCSNLDK